MNCRGYRRIQTKKNPDTFVQARCCGEGRKKSHARQVHKMQRILFTVAAIAVYKQKHTPTHSCKHDVVGYVFVCAWLMLTRIFFEHADFKIVKINGFYKMICAESGLAAVLKLTDV